MVTIRPWSYLRNGVSYVYITHPLLHTATWPFTSIMFSVIVLTSKSGVTHTKGTRDPLCLKESSHQVSPQPVQLVSQIIHCIDTGRQTDSVSVYKKKGREHCVTIVTCDFFSSFFSSFLILPKYDLFGVPASEFIPIDVTPCD